ncbi:MAG: hypothetical protein ACR2OZ_09035 [Verrucomicrobiales bacterium]
MVMAVRRIVIMICWAAMVMVVCAILGVGRQSHRVTAMLRPHMHRGEKPRKHQQQAREFADDQHSPNVGTACLIGKRVGFPGPAPPKPMPNASELAPGVRVASRCCELLGSIVTVTA